METEQHTGAPEEFQTEPQSAQPVPINIDEAVHGEIEQPDPPVAETTPELPSKPKKSRRGSKSKNLAPDSNAHFHHWRIEEANGPTSMGHCACGTEKLFNNWLDDVFMTSIETKERY